MSSSSLMARSRFTLNQLLTSNGPTVDPTQFKESTCTTDQFYNVICSACIAARPSDPSSNATESFGHSNADLVKSNA